MTTAGFYLAGEGKGFVTLYKYFVPYRPLERYKQLHARLEARFSEPHATFDCDEKEDVAASKTALFLSVTFAIALPESKISSIGEALITKSSHSL